MTITPGTQWRRIKIGCFSILGLLGIAIVAVALFAWHLWHVVPGKGTPGTDAFAAWMTEHHPADPAGVEAMESLNAAISIFAAERAKFLEERPPEEQPAEWPDNAQFPLDLFTTTRRECPDVVKSSTSEFVSRLEGANFPAVLAAACTADSFSPATASSDHVIQTSLAGNVVSYNSVRMAFAAAQGNEEPIVEAFATSMALSQAAACNPTLLDRLAAAAFSGVSLENLRSAMTEIPFSASALDSCVQILDKRADLPSIDIVFRSLQARILDGVHQSYTVNAGGDGRRVVKDHSDNSTFGLDSVAVPAWLEGFEDSPVINVLGCFHPSKKETESQFRTLFDQLSEYAQSSTLDRRLQGRPTTLPGNEEHGTPNLFLQALYGAIDRETARETFLSGTRLMLAIERHRAAHGTPPQSLNQLVPQFLTALPLDPWTGTAFGYKPLPAPDEFGRRYILYSFGNNLIDDGGAADELHHLRMLETGETDNSDFILNAPRPKYAPRR